ncbi:MAG: radical SAM protein [Desulfocurvibacter africanus]
MINIFVTYRCNLSCSYCFARELQSEYPEDMTPERFERLLRWMVQASLPAAAFIGGEPTLHPHLPDMVDRTAEAGISVVLFTNGLFPTELAERLAPCVSNFVVNYNDPAMLGPVRSYRLQENLARLRTLGAGITFSKNFSSRYCAYEYLLEGLDRHGVTRVRYDISRPSGSGTNDHFGLDDTRRIMAHAVGFVKACEARGVRTGLDCCVRLCDLEPEDRLYLERVSMKFKGICHPSMDVHPDLSASYCLPLRGVNVPDMTAFPDHSALMWHFAQAVQPLRFADAPSDCSECADYRRRCQGGCMALKGLAHAPHSKRSADIPMGAEQP